MARSDESIASHHANFMLLIQMNQVKIVTSLVFCVFFLGCATLQRDQNFQLKVSAPPGTKFSCKYEFGNSSGGLSTAATGRGYETILDIPLADGYCDITKETPGVMLAAAVFQGSRERFSFKTSTNTTSFRLVRDSTGWKSEVRK